jgi:hypothetical protein
MNQNRYAGDLLLKTRDFSSVRLATQFVTYPYRCFRQSVTVGLQTDVSLFHLMFVRVLCCDSVVGYFDKLTSAQSLSLIN